MVSNNLDDDILASSLVFVSSSANQKLKLNLWAQKNMVTISQFAHLVCEGVVKGKYASAEAMFIYAICCSCNMRSYIQRFCWAIKLRDKISWQDRRYDNGISRWAAAIYAPPVQRFISSLLTRGRSLTPQRPIHLSNVSATRNVDEAGDCVPCRLVGSFYEQDCAGAPLLVIFTLSTALCSVHFYFCILIFIFNFITVFIRVLFFYRCLDLIVYIVSFIIVLYLSIQL